MNMRDLMTLVEARGGTKLYHGSKKSFPVGFVLEPQKDGYVHANSGDEFDAQIKITEQLLEKFRPSDQLSRYESVFVTTTPATIEYAGGSTNHVYVVEPLGPIFFGNLYWYSQIENAAFDIDDYDPDELRSWAQNYWAAKPSGQSETYEYRTNKARIVKEVKWR
jgi:hypothetical protein